MKHSMWLTLFPECRGGGVVRRYGGRQDGGVWRRIVAVEKDRCRVIIKYGTDPIIAKEAGVYQWLQEKKAPCVPRLLGRQEREGNFGLMVEHCPGRRARFERAREVEQVFLARGHCMAHTGTADAHHWSSSPSADEEFTMGAVYRSRSRLAQLVDENSEEGHLLIRAAEVMERNAEWAAAVARMVPRVAHHGDLSKENALVDGVNVRFVDFEHAQVVYLGDALWTLGEDWGSLPRHEMVDVALRSIVNGYFGSNVARDVYSNAIMA